MAEDRSGATGSAGAAAAWGLRAVAALVLLCAVASLSWPFGWDQGIFAWVGDVMHRGGMPYRDAWDMKGPLAYCVFAFAENLFGANTWGIRVVDLVLVAAACTTLARVTRHLTDRATGTWAALLFALWYASGAYWHTAQPDGWTGFLVLAALAPLLVAGDDVGALRAGGAGACVGFTVIVKPFYGAFLVVVLLALVLHLRRNPRRLAACVAAALVGFAAPVAATAAWLSHRGVLGDYVDVALRYPATLYVGGLAPKLGERVRGVADFVRSGNVAVVALAPAAYGLVRLRRTAPRTAAVLAAWTAMALAGVVAQAKFFEYHWLPIHAPIAVLAAVGMHRALTAENAAPSRGFAVAAFVVVAVHACLHPAFEVARWGARVAGLTTEDAYVDGFGVPGDDRRAARLIASRSGDDDEVAVWGWNTAIPFMSGRRVATRFGFSMPLMMGGDTATRRAYRDEFMAALRGRPPLYVVDAPQAERLLGGRFDMNDFPEFAQFVAGRYAEEARFGEIRVLRRVDPPGRR